MLVEENFINLIFSNALLLIIEGICFYTQKDNNFSYIKLQQYQNIKKNS